MDNRIFSCDICGQSLVGRRSLDRHFDRHRGLQCEICQRKYINRNNLKNHLRSHFDKSYFVICDICGKSVSSWKLRRHKEQHVPKEGKREEAKTKIYSCRFCGLTFDKVNNRSSHEKRIHRTKVNDGRDIFKCSVCSVTFRTKENLREHSFTHFAGKTFACDFPGCARVFKKGKLLTVHRRCHFEPQFKCLDCGQPFVQKAGLTKHTRERRCPAVKKSTEESQITAEMAERAKEQYIELRGSLFRSEKVEILKNEPEAEEEWHYEFLDEALIEDEQKFYSCDLCGELRKTKIELKRHIITHRVNNTREITKKSRSEPFICDRCGKDFRSRSSIQTHLLVTHKTVADYKCVMCSRHFKSHGNLFRHIKSVHEEEKLWGCEKCGKMFKERYQLDIHLHNHDEPSPCLICGRMVSNMKVHVRNHAVRANNTRVECDLCSRVMGKYQLMRHIKTVHEKQFRRDTSSAGLKVYACKACGDFFSRRHELRQHEYVTHNASKLFECTLCGTFFTKLKLLNVHRFTHEPQNVSCEVCSKVYARKGALWKHQKKKHPELVTPQERKIK